MPIELDRQKIDAALPKVAPGLAKYLRIMEFVANVPAFHDDPEFRRSFNGFYRVRRSAQTWQPHFFALMDRARSQNAEDLLSGLVSEGNHVFELGVDELPSGAKDIRESLLCSPGRVFVSMLFGEPDYFCIVELP